MEAFQDLLEATSPYLFVQLGVFSVLGLSILGAAIGIFNAGAPLATATVYHPEIKSKNLLSGLFCEAIALYGVIMAIILYAVLQPGAEAFTDPETHLEEARENYRAGFGIFAAGTSVGLSNLAAAITVGVIGGSVVLAHSNNGSLFVKLFISEIFGEAIALIGLIAGIVITTSVRFSVV